MPCLKREQYWSHEIGNDACYWRAFRGERERQRDL